MSGFPKSIGPSKLGPYETMTNDPATKDEQLVTEDQRLSTND